MGHNFQKRMENPVIIFRKKKQENNLYRAKVPHQITKNLVNLAKMKLILKNI